MLLVGTDCSGIDTPLFAIRSLGIQHRHVFSSDTDPHCRTTILANHSPEVFYGDIRKRDPATTPYCDLYVCGFPCQPFSVAGKQGGTSDERGDVFLSCLEYIRVQNPRWFILENVRNLVSIEDGRVFDSMLTGLRALGTHFVHHKILNTSDYGIPQSRRRLYIVGSRDGAFAFPDPVPPRPLAEYVDVDDRSITDTSRTKRDRASLCRALSEEMRRRGIEVVFFDQLHMQRSKPDPIVKSGYPLCPCVTANSYHWNVPMNRRASVKELLALQGLPADARMVVPESAFRRIIGNAMSANVVAALVSALTRGES